MRTTLAITRATRGSVLLAFCLLVVGPGCTGSEPSAHGPSDRHTLVETAAPSVEDVVITLRAVGSMRASEHAEMRPQVEAVVAQILFEEGAEVSKGDILIELDARKAEASRALSAAALDRALAGLAVAEQKLRRHKRLIEDKLIADETYEEALAEFKGADAAAREARAALDLAQTRLDDFSIRAPFDGRVGARLVDTGNFVEKGTPLTDVYNTNPIEVEFGVPDRHANDVNEGTKVTVSGQGREPVTGTVTFIDPRVDPVTRLLKLKATITNTNGTLKPGQFVEISIVTEVRRNQLMVPEQAVVSADGQTWVFVVDNDKATRRLVELGTRTPQKVEVISGIEPGARIVVSGQHRLSDGDDVETLVPDQAEKKIADTAEAPAG